MGEVLLHLIGPAVEELVLVHGAVRAALSGGAVVGAVEHDRVLELAGLLQVVDDPPDLMVGVLGEAREHLGHPREELLLIVGERVPRSHVIQRRIGALGHRVHRRQLRSLGENALLDHPGQRPLAVGLVAVVEDALVLVDVLLRRMVRRVIRAGAEPHEPWTRRRGRLDVTDHPDRLIGKILREVIALLRRVRLLDAVVVDREIGIPLVRLAAEEAVEAIEALMQRPALLRRARMQIIDRHAVVLAEPERAPAGRPHHLGERAALRRDVRVRARVADRTLGDAGHPVLMVVTPCQKARAGRGAQRGRVPLRVRDAVVGEPLQRRHLDPAAERLPGGEPRVVVQHDQHVGRPLRRPPT